MVTLIDADVIVIDKRYFSDPRFAINRQFVDRMRAEPHRFGMVVHAVLEAIGILSFNVALNIVPRLALHMQNWYGFTIVPNWSDDLQYAGITIDEIMKQVIKRMALGDAVQSPQILKYEPSAVALITWNAKHFVGKLPIPVMSPADWLSANP